MSATPILSPRQLPSPAAARTLLRGRPEDPWWSRPGLIAVGALAAVLAVWGLTSNGDGNGYYAEAALAASRSWKALFTNAADLSGFVSLDKGPLSDWMMGLSGRIFGFGSLSMLLPNALCGVAAVVLLHRLVLRAFGHVTALLAALMLAISPISVAMARYNNPDALLALLLVAAAWALVRSLESGRLRHIVLCGAFVGLAFNTKMLEAYLIVPGLAIAFLIAGQGDLRRRLSHLLAGGATLVVVSVAWFTTMMLIPAADRPYVGDSTNNSWFQLIFGANGFSRVTGGGQGGFGGGRSLRLAHLNPALASRISAFAKHGGGSVGAMFGGPTGALRLFGTEVGGQIAWLLPLALAGLLAGLWLRRRAARTDLGRAALVMFGLWALAGYVVFSFSQGGFHPYYTSAIAPAVSALAAVAIVTLSARVRRAWAAAALLAAAVAGTTAASFIVLHRTPDFVSWLRYAVLAAGIGTVAAILLARFGDRVPRRPAAVGALLVGAIAVLGGPVAYSVATVDHGQSGSDPKAGPASLSSGGFGGFLGIGRRGLADLSGSGFTPPTGGVSSLFEGGDAGAGASGLPALGGLGGSGQTGGSGFPGAAGGGGSNTPNRAILRYLEAHRDGAKYLVAASGAISVAPYGLASRDPVIAMGGFAGMDPAPTVAQLRSLIRSGQLRFVLGGGLGGFGGGGGVSAARTKWVQAHCQTVSVPGASATGAASDLYLCTGADAAG